MGISLSSSSLYLNPAAPDKMKWPALFPAVLPIIVLFCNCLSFVNGRTGVLVATESGKVRGTVSLSRIRREFYSWKGIPFAEPPLGRLRFAVGQAQLQKC